jgi:PAS domain S-box-containing protein
VNQATAALQRRHIEEKLRRSEWELADFFENATVGLHWVGPDGIILRANRAELNLLGYSAEEYIGRHIAEFHADEDAIGDILRRLLAGEELHDYEARMRCKDGTLRHVAISSNSLREDGRFIHTRCFTRDISDRKRIEEALRRQSNQFTTLVEHIPDIVARLDRDLRYLYMGPAVRAITGTPAHEYIGKPRTNAGLAPEFAEARERLSRKVFDTGQEEILEFPIRTPAGERVLECRFIPEFAPDGSVETLMTLTRDVTERKRADELLRASEERFRMVADNISQLTWTCDQLGNVTWYNKRWLDYTGLSFEEMKGWGWTKVHHPDHLDRVVDGVARSRESGEIWEDTFPLRGKDGTYRWFLSRAVPIRNEAGDVVQWFGTSTDITEERLLQESLRESDRRKDEFLATLAHELRNPLAPIRTGLEVLKMTTGDAAATSAIRASMERQTQQLITLVDDLLDVSRITRGRLKLQMARVELADIVHSAVETSKPHIDAAGHQLTVSLPDSPLYLDADPYRLSQVLANLLNNAAKYTPERGRIRLTARQSGGEVVVTVEDSGIGIPADMYERVFEMFTQIERPVEKGHTGLGIGLTLVKSLVEMHGGTIGVRSDGENRGSTFTVHLPLAAGAPAAAGAPEAAAEETVLRRARRVLVVDDNEAAAEMLAMLLGMLGNDVRTAGDGEQALEVGAEFQPEVVLMDLGMPKMDGYEAATRMRATPWGRHAVLIALTGWGQEEAKQRTEAAGFDHHLVKPANPGALQAILADPSAVSRR